jgi:uncharacterized integral membrane protein
MVEQERPDSPDTDEIPVQTPPPVPPAAASPATEGRAGAGRARVAEDRPTGRGTPVTQIRPTRVQPTAGGGQAVPSGTGKAQEYRNVKRTRFSGLWVGATIAAVVLLILLVFIIQNSQQAAISFFGAHGHLPLGVALLLAAICGVLLVAIPGYGRIIQLRRALKRSATVPTAPPAPPVAPVAAPAPRSAKDAGHNATI